MTLLAAVFHLCAAANQGHADEVCPTSAVVSWTTAIRREASKNSLDPYMVAALIQRESAFDVRAKSRVGATGLMQLMPASKASDGLPAHQIRNPARNIKLGCRHIRRWLQFCGDLHGALSAYSGRGHCRPSKYSRAILKRSAEVRDDVVPTYQLGDFLVNAR